MGPGTSHISIPAVVIQTADMEIPSHLALVEPSTRLAVIPDTDEKYTEASNHVKIRGRPP
jgi:hypothetical protein